jgi:hypothetical protein
MNSKYQEALPLMHSEVVNSAQAKLGRPLSVAEISGVQRIDSLMRLESLWQAFSSPAYLPEQVEKDLSFFSEKGQHGSLA